MKRTEISTEEIRQKSIYLVKMGKVQEDFEYIFSDIPIMGYIEDIDTPLPEDMINKDSFLIICDNKDGTEEKYTSRYEREEVDFCFAEDLFHELDFDFGGVIGDRELVICLDDNEDSFERKQLFQAEIDRVIHPSDLKKCDRRKAYIVFRGYASDKVPVLKRLGFEEEKDFIFLSWLEQMDKHRPSELMKRTTFAQPQEQPDCGWPFFFAQIQSNGDVYNCCCQAFVEFGIGNIKSSSCDAIWNSIYAKLMRLSIINRTFCFCNNYCGAIDPKRPLAKYLRKRYRHETLESPSRINPCIDGSCNLFCESCRSSLCFAKGVEADEINYMAEQILDSTWLTGENDTLQLSGWGEVFYSKAYQKLLFDRKGRFKNVRILSNGTLFSPERFDRLYDLYRGIEVISISVDAATEDTYRQIRRGGNWKNLQHNLAYIGKQRQNGKVSFFELTMVVQRRNYTEIPDFAKMGIELHADKVTFFVMRHFNPQVSREEYVYQSMLTGNGEEVNQELRDVFRDPILQDPRVSYDWFKQRML